MDYQSRILLLLFLRKHGLNFHFTNYLTQGPTSTMDYHSRHGHDVCSFDLPSTREQAIPFSVPLRNGLFGLAHNSMQIDCPQFLPPRLWKSSTAARPVTYQPVFRALTVLFRETSWATTKMDRKKHRTVAALERARSQSSGARQV